MNGRDIGRESSLELPVTVVAQLCLTIILVFSRVKHAPDKSGRNHSRHHNMQPGLLPLSRLDIIPESSLRSWNSPWTLI